MAGSFLKKIKIGKKMRAALVIPTYNREEVLVNTLKSALALRPAPDEILVIDQTEAHEETTNRFLKNLHQKRRVRWINQQPPSLTEARNRAIHETKCDVIVFIDDDVELPITFILKHLKNYENEKIQAVAGGVSQKNKPQYPNPPSSGKWPRTLDYKYFSVFGKKRVEGVATFMGCNHSARTEVLKRLGGYDANYIGSAFREDTDMAVRIWKSGGLIVFDPKAGLTHLAAPSGGCRINSGSKTNPEWWVSFNRHYFSFRHLFLTREFWLLIFFKDFRQTVLRKSNLLRPWLIPRAFLAYGYSIVRAIKKALEKRTDSSTN